MVNCWQPGVQYNIGDVVEYEGHGYRVIQAHFSESTWAPGPNTEALWGCIPDNECQQPLQPTPQPQGVACQTSSCEKQWNEHTEQQVDIPHEEHKKKWWDLTDERKKQVEIGGGLVAGLAALGAGYYAYHEHEKNEETKKAHVWALQSWLAEAKARTQEYYSRGASSSLTWILIEGHDIPDNAIVGGNEGGKTLYISRAFCDGGLQVGKAGRHLSKGAVYGYSHKSFEISTYEILVGDNRAVAWYPTGGVLRVDQLGGKRLVEGGKENDGTPIYVAQVDYNGLQPGKATTVLDGAYIAYGSEEKKVKEYSVLYYV